MSVPPPPGRLGLPAHMLQRAHSVAYSLGQWQVPEARDAATICVVRDGVAGLEVFMMRRIPTLAFAPGMHVFPGGAVEVSDSLAPAVAHVDWAALALRTSSADPRALLSAAVRETFEECRVLLAVTAAGEAPAASADLEADRLALVAGELSWVDLLERRGLLLDPGEVVACGHWVTPEVEDRRYDTRFFVAALPGGQQGDEVIGEADRAGWWRPVDALAAYAGGQMAMLPPTLASLQQLAAYSTVAQVRAEAPDLGSRPQMPRPVPDGHGGVRWVMVDAHTGEVLVADLGAGPADFERNGVRA